MIDMDRIDELRGEIGAEDLDLVLDLFLEEANAAIERLESGREVCELGRIIHFLHGGALNMGLRGFAVTAATIEAERISDPLVAASRLRAILERTQADLTILPA